LEHDAHVDSDSLTVSSASEDDTTLPDLPTTVIILTLKVDGKKKLFRALLYSGTTRSLITKQAQQCAGLKTRQNEPDKWHNLRM
jgi:hypothetical protein